MKDPFSRPREPDRDDCNDAGGDDGGDGVMLVVMMAVVEGWSAQCCVRE